MTYPALDASIRDALRQRGVRYDEMNDTIQDTWIALLIDTFGRHRPELRVAVEDALQRLQKRQFRVITLKMEGASTCSK